MAEGDRDIPEDERKKAQTFFDRGNAVAGTGNFEYSIEMYLQGLKIDPENTRGHQMLREISLKRKASKGKDLGFVEKMKLKKAGKDDKENLLNAEKVLAYDPGNTDAMVGVLKTAHKGGYYATAMWIGALLQKANDDLGAKADFNKYIFLRETYKSMGQWKEAVEACHRAALVRPDDMDIQTELKHLGAQLTMKDGKYLTGGSFRDSIRDREGQEALMEADKDVRTVDSMAKAVAAAEIEWKAEPHEPGKLMKYVDALRKTETLENENRAIEVFEEAWKRTEQFRFRKAAGEIKLSQLARMERGLITRLRADPSDEDLIRQIKQSKRERAEEELKEYTLWAENYPTETGFRFSMAQRMFELGRFDECIPIFQDVRRDPKYRGDAGILLGRAFMEAGFLDEASDTLREAIEAYQLRGDEKSINMHYYYGRVLEAKGDTAAAIKAYSQVAQWNFNYRDVQVRIKKLRAPGQGGGPAAASA